MKNTTRVIELKVMRPASTCDVPSTGYRTIADSELDRQLRFYFENPRETRIVSRRLTSPSSRIEIVRISHGVDSVVDGPDRLTFMGPVPPGRSRIVDSTHGLLGTREGHDLVA